MRLFFTRRVKFAVIALLLFVSTTALLALLLFRDRRPPDVREFSAIMEEWERTIYGHALAGDYWTMLAD
jgi:hypothetical protein